jgi:hypothetical protein
LVAEGLFGSPEHDDRPVDRAASRDMLPKAFDVFI